MIIYKVTNNINGKVYIGQTTRSLRSRWKQHCYAAEDGHKGSHLSLQKDIAKYGPGNFSVKQIDVACSHKELDEKEKYWIKYYDSRQPRGYNYYSGGNGYVPREETLEKLRGKNHWTTRKSFSDSTKKRMSDAQKGAKSNNHRACICVDTGETFPYVKAAAMKYGLSDSHIHSVCKGIRKRCGGFRWEYIPDDEVIHNKDM